MRKWGGCECDVRVCQMPISPSRAKRGNEHAVHCSVRKKESVNDDENAEETFLKRPTHFCAVQWQFILSIRIPLVLSRVE